MWKGLDDSVVSALTIDEVATVLAYAEYNMNAHETARETFFHRNTIEYRLKKVKQKTGLDPFNFYDLVKLVASLGNVDGSV